MQFNYYYILN